MSQISEDARKMRDYIDKNGWVQHSYGHSAGVCVVGAYNSITSGHAQSHSERERHVENNPTILAIKDYIQTSFIGAEWNDTPGRTKQEVLDMLENVAIKHDDDAYTSGANNDTV